ncbi:MAG: hypothetical protein ACPHAN_12015 [Pseudomonadales bacterium]
MGILGLSMSEIFATISLGKVGNNVQPLGVLTAFLVTHQLLNEIVLARHAGAVAAIRMQSMSGAAFLTTVLDGELRFDALSSEGRDFCRDYAGSELESEVLLRSTEGDLEDWALYEEVAASLYRMLKRSSAPPPSRLKQLTAKILSFPPRKKGG